MSDIGHCDPADCDCDTNPYHMCCLADQFASVVDSAADRLESDNGVALSQAARRALYVYGHEHVKTFKLTLAAKGGHDRLVDSLHGELVKAGLDRGSAEAPLNPPQVSLPGLSEALAAKRWSPG